MRDGFGPEPKFRALISDWNGEPAGYALFYPFYSTWEGRAGIFLEDLFVREQFRGRGIGKTLLAEVARVALQGNFFALRWEVLDWNENAIRLYKSLGSEFREQWRSVSLSGDPLGRLAGKALPA
jgi:GNAT superfamily N-acetyltransferase